MTATANAAPSLLLPRRLDQQEDTLSRLLANVINHHRPMVLPNDDDDDNTHKSAPFAIHHDVNVDDNDDDDLLRQSLVLLADVWIALGKMIHHHNHHNIRMDLMAHVVTQLWTCMDHSFQEGTPPPAAVQNVPASSSSVVAVAATTRLPPKRLVECLQALACLETQGLLHMNETVHHQCSGCASSSFSLMERWCLRLQQGDALAKLSAKHLAMGIKSAVMLLGAAEGQETSEQYDCNEKTELLLRMLRAFMRRWRKQGVRQGATTASICQTLHAARRLWQRAQHAKHENVRLLLAETETMVYTLLRELLGSRSGETDTGTMTTGHNASALSTLTLRSSSSWTAGQVAEIILTATAFGVNVTNPIYSHLMTLLLQEEQDTVERASLSDIARILLSMDKVKLCNYPMVVQRLGLHFFKLVQHEATTSKGMETMEPRSVCTILKSSLRLHSRDKDVMEPFTMAATFLLVHHDEHNKSILLQNCCDMELSSLVRFLFVTRCQEEEALIALADRILQPDIAESCSPVAASRILTYFTALLDSSTQNLTGLRPRLSDLFHELGTHLLSAQLPPAETSAAMQAYARALYVRDMGIFDHLARHLEMSCLKDCSIRHVSQSLWACGKMVVWESSEHGDNQDSAEQPTLSGPPYMKAARAYASFLASRATEMTTRDVAQAIWAIGRLRIMAQDNAKVVSTFALRACQVVSEFSSLDVANTLWGLSRVGFDNRRVVSVLTNRMLEMEPSSQEAATVLYALGRLGIRDETVFAAMSDVMMEQLETASAQAIANALWAFRTIHISPPRELMDGWVVQKLGMDLNTTTTERKRRTRQ